MNTPLHNLYKENNQILLTYKSLVVHSMYQLHLHNTLKWPQRRLWIYVGFDSLAIIRYLEPLIGDVFIVYFSNCHFNESIFPPLGRENLAPKEKREITWNASMMSHFDTRTNKCELEV